MSSADPISYRTLKPGTAVISADGQQVGTVKHVLADEQLDVFDGIVIDTRLGPGGLHFVDAPQIAELREDAVVITLPAEEVPRLPKPARNPAVMEHHGVEDVESPLAHKLHRAWEMVSGLG
jgi:uncharacterized protein YrrD